jgi:hypothetical protein
MGCDDGATTSPAAASEGWDGKWIEFQRVGDL